MFVLPLSLFLCKCSGVLCLLASCGEWESGLLHKASYPITEPIESPNNIKELYNFRQTLEKNLLFENLIILQTYKINSAIKSKSFSFNKIPINLICHSNNIRNYVLIVM